MKPIITEEITDSIYPATGKDSKGRFAKANPFGGLRPNSGRKPMPEARKQALEAFHDGLPEAVRYLQECLRSHDPEEKRWACELMIKKGIPGVEALLIHGQIEKSSSVFGLPPMPPGMEEEMRKLADKYADIETLAIPEKESDLKDPV